MNPLSFTDKLTPEELEELNKLLSKTTSTSTPKSAKEDVERFKSSLNKDELLLGLVLLELYTQKEGELDLENVVSNLLPKVTSVDNTSKAFLRSLRASIKNTAAEANQIARTQKKKTVKAVVKPDPIVIDNGLDLGL